MGSGFAGLNEWLSGRRFFEDKEKNEKWDDELQKIEDPSVEQGRRDRTGELPENDLQQEEEQELPEDDWAAGKRSQSRSCRRMTLAGREGRTGIAGG